MGVRMKPNGGPAFPLPDCLVDDFDRQTGGMSLRDYFAAAYLCGFAMRPISDDPPTPEQKAALAYIHADAMLAERDR